ncbi:MAG: Hsp20/alpha crystallin family protein [Candidatus Aminicenantes bacterium]|nr:Hsp20/alpha crystallin family protein [Candidatus Aminicenantes bacterium]
MIKKIIPVLKLVRLEHEIHRIQPRTVFRGAECPVFGEGYVPRMDVCVRERDIVVELEMPGVLPEDIVILVHYNRLEVKGLKKQDLLPEGGTYLRVEREYGLFRRVIDLPSSIQPDRAKASLQDGILVITLRKPEGARKKA